MVRTIIFDLAEVLIAGILGVEQILAPKLEIDETTILTSFQNEVFQDLMCGHVTEDFYIEQILKNTNWNITSHEMKQAIRQNFHKQVQGMEDLLDCLSRNYEVVLISDHAKEWIDYIQSYYPFMQNFSLQFYSFEIKQTKSEPSTFLMLLQAINREPNECLFIDDRKSNISNAISVGIPSIHFKTEKQLSQVLEEYGIINFEEDSG